MVCVVAMCFVQFSPQNEWTLLHWAALGGSVEVIEWLMAHYTLEVGEKTKV